MPASLPAANDAPAANDEQQSGSQNGSLEQGSVQMTGLGVARKRAIESARRVGGRAPAPRPSAAPLPAALTLCRHVERRELPLVHDPLLRALVDTDTPDARAWAAAEDARLAAAAAGGAASSAGGHAGAESGDEADKQALVTLALRCRYIDDEILSIAHALRRALARLSLEAAPGGGGGAGAGGAGAAARRPRIQVILLGAGLDTRPWRLTLGHDVSWFEVDMPDSVAFKHGLLERAGVQTVAPVGTFSGGGAGAGRCGEVARGPAADASMDPGAAAPPRRPRFPLRAGRWAALAADLSAPGLLPRLEAAGWDPSAPTVWVIEGVHYYLQQEAADQLVATIAGASCAAGLGAVCMSACSPAMVRGINAAKRGWKAAAAAAAAPQEGGGSGGAQEWWWQADFPDYEATLGDDPCAALLKAGWEAAHVVTTAELEGAYASARSTRLLPAAVCAAAAAACGGAASEYQVATATLGL
eukprot:scaffold5.g961.t1